MDTPKRIVCWFSQGVTSAVAAKIAKDAWIGKVPLSLVSCDTGSEDDDNWRFARDVSNWLDLPLEIIKSEKYVDTFDVYEKTGYLVGTAGARCSLELKKMPRRKYEDLGGDLQVFGFDMNEKKRAKEFSKNNPEVWTWFPLIEIGITKNDARQMLLSAGIAEPATYGEGFKNANCLKRGCVKGGMGYWNHVRKMRPAVFENMAKMERARGHAICRREERGPNGERLKIPVFLDELPPDAGDYDSEPAFQCGLFCGTDFKRRR